HGDQRPREVLLAHARRQAAPRARERQLVPSFIGHHAGRQTPGGLTMGVNRWLTAVRMRLRSLVRLRTAERELNEELQFHVEQATAENIARGMKPAAARRAALLAMGGLDQHKEDCREARGLTLLRSMGRDGRLAVRLLRRQPAFSAVVVLTLSAGVGALISVVTV